MVFGGKADRTAGCAAQFSQSGYGEVVRCSGWHRQCDFGRASVVYYPHMLVHPDYQGKGIGRKMMEAMQTVYGEFHQQMLTADRGAIEFYKALGFERGRRYRAHVDF